MKVELKADVMLVVTAETELEIFALSNWQYNLDKLLICFSKIEENQNS